MVLGLKLTGKLVTRKYMCWTEPGLAWSLDLNLWETNYLKRKVLDRTKILHGPQTQTYGETSHSKRLSARERERGRGRERER